MVMVLLALSITRSLLMVGEGSAASVREGNSKMNETSESFMMKSLGLESRCATID